MTQDQSKELADTLLNTYLIIAHDGNGLKGEHYFVEQDELTSVIEQEVVLEEL